MPEIMEIKDSAEKVLSDACYSMRSLETQLRMTQAKAQELEAALYALRLKNIELTAYINLLEK